MMGRVRRWNAGMLVVVFAVLVACSHPNPISQGDAAEARVDHSGTPPATRPNILVIMADDFGFNDLAINNDNKEIDTPNLDQFARDGVRFTRHYAAAVCSPARASFLTGYVPERLGFLPNARGISPQITTLPERLRQEGYTTWHIGKWHIGDLERTAWPDYQGFDHWFGFLNSDRLAGKKLPNGEIELVRARYQNPWLQGDTEPGRHFSGHLENILTDKAIAVLSELQAAQQPWFLNLWFFAPHAPVKPAAEFAQKYPATRAGEYQALVNQLDYNVGRVLAHLQAIDAARNTIVVFVSDNGGTNAALDNNAPFRGAKTTLTEGGMRTPLVIRWPDHAMNGQVITDAVSIDDIYPTLLASIGVAPEASLDGVSFYDNVQHHTSIRQRPRYWDHFNGMSSSYSVLTIDGRWRLNQYFPYFGKAVEPMLYDFELDPHGTQAVLPPPAPQLEQMLADYRAWYPGVHTVATEYAPQANGSGVLTGTDFLRTPGYGSYTFGMGIGLDQDGLLASQAGIWELRRDGNTLTATFGKVVLSGEIQRQSQCSSVVITGNFHRRLLGFTRTDQISLAMFIDGRQVDTRLVDGYLPVEDPTVETLIGDPEAPSSEVRSPPVILNTQLNATTPVTVEAFSQTVCDRS